MGRPPLTERRKAATRLEIAETAVRLFAEQGVAATSADEIAAASGVSTRTLWRYFATKESCVRPLLSVGVDSLAAAFRDAPPDRPLAEVFAAVQMGEMEAYRERDGEPVLTLVRLTRTEPGLRAVWLQTHLEAEPVLAAALAHRAGEDPEALRPRVAAAVINVALRVAVEDFAWKPATPGRTMEAVTREAVRIAAEGL
ncbi:TetR/AcrR family transcriptional regulator [uncultured Streptomyces sp.]|uniref:TetR/AcrR family transcriptional regulator n=1 Tax=uncultured Streptomyces sp. TaxID=174707 RepID=UPI00262B119A|nr:TetR/AcrR family transcriptional regulator [uncultured Streptomyces sp.]